MGDFNIHVDDPNDPLSKAFTALMYSTGLTQVVSKPTHLYSYGARKLTKVSEFEYINIYKYLYVEFHKTEIFYC